MVYLHVCLLHGSQSALALVDRGCSYINLVNMIMSEFSLNPTKVAVSLKYILNDDLLAIRIKNDSNVLAYILLKEVDRDPAKYPLIIDLIDAVMQYPSDMVTDNAYCNSELYTLQDVATEICEASSKHLGHICDNEVTIVSIADAIQVEEGRIFRDKDILKLSLSFFAIRNMFEFMVERSDKKEYVVRCSHEGCTWICRSSKWGKTNLFKIRKIGSYTCASNVVLGSHRQVSAGVVSSSIKYKYTSTGTIYTPEDICSDMLHTFGVYLNYSKAWRSREQTLKMIRGDPTESFGRIPSFFYMVRQRNPGTVTELEVDSHNRFKLVIVVDGTYLNGHYGGTLFTACTQDANNGIFVLAFGVGDNENDKSWRWFLEKLKNAYGHREGLCFVSDRHGNIKKAIEQVYPESCHGICSYHLLQNLKSYYGKSEQNIMQAFNSAVRAYTLEEFEYNMQQLDAMNDKIHDCLANRYSTMISNIIESVNAVTKAVKNYPIVFLLESLRQTVSVTWNVSPSNQTVFSVSDERSTFVVDIEQRTCTCRMLQVDLMPCPHASTIIAHTKRDAYSYCSYYYTKEAYVNAYESSVYPVGNPDEWRVPDEVEFQIVLASNQKWSSGRPTENRKRSSREGKPKVRCGRCGAHGHNRRRCLSLVPLSKNG
ncbi:uncharacterized protein LOC111377934 [Olea europaea var. sylvestris]|uniref:uncharacterized protein LOC111377934 n=1 Tax=Olea europaea var. sylvestris TaxID=158386 RepID=UPI000C1D3A1A|nr:uncharacterized protein LOC111377934 [Olea europaea var. sylvestris]